MKRILVTGNAGSGKSTLARRISSQLNISCYSMDGVVWQSGWKKTPQAEKARRVQELTEPDFWVIDGVSPEVQSTADTVIFLDVDRRISFWRVCKRNWRYLFRSRPELPAGCPEILIIPTPFKIIWNFPSRIRPRILEQSGQERGFQKFFHLKTQADLRRFLSLLEGVALSNKKPDKPVPHLSRSAEKKPMSNNRIAVVPEDPNFVPNADTHAAALDLFRAIAPDVEEIEIKLTLQSLVGLMIEGAFEESAEYHSSQPNNLSHPPRGEADLGGKLR